MINQYSQELLEKRKVEIQAGILESATKKRLVEVKSVTDQFNYIFGIAASISKSSHELITTGHT